MEKMGRVRVSPSGFEVNEWRVDMRGIMSNVGFNTEDAEFAEGGGRVNAARLGEGEEAAGDVVGDENSSRLRASMGNGSMG